MDIDPNRSAGDLQCVKSKCQSSVEDKNPADEILCLVAGAFVKKPDIRKRIGLSVRKELDR